MTDFTTALDAPELSLEDFLAQSGEPTDFSNDGYAISNDDEALWVVRRIAQAQRRVDEVKRQAQVELDRINAWVEANTVKNQKVVDHLETLVGDYLMKVREDEQDGRKSLDFPDGKVTSRVTAPKVAVGDLDAFLEWAEANGKTEWIRVKREADVSTIKKIADLNGDVVIDPISGAVIEGLVATEGGVSITVATN